MIQPKGYIISMSADLTNRNTRCNGSDDDSRGTDDRVKDDARQRTGTQKENAD